MLVPSAPDHARSGRLDAPSCIFHEWFPVQNKRGGRGVGFTAHCRARCAQYAAGAGADGTSWRALCHTDRGFEHTDGDRGGVGR